jgi:CubicO group peptidase (beta-lactamase class C family)
MNRSRWLPTLLLPLVLLAAGIEAQEAHPLARGGAVTHTLAAGESRSYQLDVEAETFVAGRVDQIGVEVDITIFGPDGERTGRFTSSLGKGAPMTFRFTSDEAGTYRIEVAPRSEEAGGEFRILLDRVEPVATTPEGRVDQAMSMFYDDTPGGVVAVIRGGELDFVRGYGMADLSHNVPFTENTVTNIGSTSKQFTGFALALLHHRGELSLEDDVRKHLPELKDFGPTITLRHLLTHTTGYREFVNTLLLAGRQVLESDFISPSEVMDVINRQPRLQNEPGEEFNYNNTAFNLATQVVERVTGRPFHEWMRDEVFLPLGMRHTWVRVDPGQVLPNRAAGYSSSPVGFRDMRDLGGSAGAGGIYTTVGDLARWMGNFRTAELGGPEVIRELTTAYVLNDGETTNYGLGLFMDEARGLKRWQHGGNDIGHASIFVYYPDLDAGYTVQRNLSGAPGGIGNVVAEAFFGEHMESPRAVAEEETVGDLEDGSLVTTETLEAYVGRYNLSGMIITVSLDDETLQLQVAGQSATPLRPNSDSTFTLEGVDAQVTFHVAGDGEVEAMTLHQAGNHRATRVLEAEEEVAVDLADFTGRYFSEELETFYELVIEDDRLAILHRRFGPALLNHSEGDVFTGTLPVTRMEFERDDAGKVTGFLAGNGRARDIRFERVGS